MVRTFVVALAVACLLVASCGQEQPAPAQPKPAAKPVVEPVAPATPAPAVEPAKPVATPAVAPKVTEPAATGKAPPPAAPVAPIAPAKPAVKIPAVPDTVTLAASQGKVTLSHLVHAKRFPCATCHGDGIPGKINLNKESAHALCRDCHKAKGAGPAACGDCHKK